MLAQIGLMYLLVLFLYCISKDVIKSCGVLDRQFLEQNYKFSYNNYHNIQFLELTPRYLILRTNTTIVSLQHEHSFQ